MWNPLNCFKKSPTTNGPLFSPEEITISENNRIEFSVVLRNKLLSQLDSVDIRLKGLYEDLILNPNMYEVVVTEWDVETRRGYTARKFKLIKNGIYTNITLVLAESYLARFSNTPPDNVINFFLNNERFGRTYTRGEYKIHYAIYEILFKRQKVIDNLSRGAVHKMEEKRKEKVAAKVMQAIGKV